MFSLSLSLSLALVHSFLLDRFSFKYLIFLPVYHTHSEDQARENSYRLSFSYHHYECKLRPKQHPLLSVQVSLSNRTCALSHTLTRNTSSEKKGEKRQLTWWNGKGVIDRIIPFLSLSRSFGQTHWLSNAQTHTSSWQKRLFNKFLKERMVTDKPFGGI